MTKINKLGKSTFVIAILSFLLVAVLAFGGTYAYFSDQSEKLSGSVTTGHLKITSMKEGEATVTNAITMSGVAQPNKVIYDNTLSLDVNNNIAYYTRLKLTVSIARDDTHQHTVQDNAETTDVTEKCADDLGAALNILSFTTADITSGDWATISTEANFANGDSADLYIYKLAPTAADSTELETFDLKIQVKPIMGLAVSGSADGCEYWIDATITVTVQWEVLQADYLNAGADNPETDGVNETVGITFASGDAAAAAWTTALTGVQA